jgi:CubicO group peptidase (beta-lactamase class C family)
MPADEYARKCIFRPLGQLLLQHGRWNDRQLVPSDYIGEATQTQESARFPAGGPLLGYGYQFWTLPPHGFAAIGFGGQVISVFPRRDLVVVTKGAITDIDPNGLFGLLREIAETAPPH